MADVTDHHVNMAAVKDTDLLPDRQRGWRDFTKATTWGIVAVIVLLVGVYVMFG